MKKISIILILFFCIKNHIFSVDSLDEKKIKIRQDFLKSKRIQKFYKKWKGTKYEWGGESKLGVDCSALMKKLYEEKFFKEISRTTLTQINEGEKIEKRSEWRVGDLIFFKMGDNMRHVGVYVGNNKFMHSGSSTGVTISEFNEYWKKRYWQTRRIPMISKNKKTKKHVDTI